ncbi:MAG: transcription antitermination protein NusB [Rickettsiales bacterium]|mgnify:CR=1 FL=1|jgi:transcription antitermination factor NusB|nr:transcription antitermination protein NusB [Rickettsiales bacterium]
MMMNDNELSSLLDDFSKQRRSRIVAMQSVYNIEFIEDQDAMLISLDNNISLYLEGRKNPERYLNRDLICKIFNYALENYKNLNFEIIKYLKNEDSFEGLSQNIKAILRSAISEIIVFPETDAPIIINEYTDISKEFESLEKSKFINAILDKAAKSLRS